jgi:hypothetical protein
MPFETTARRPETFHYRSNGFVQGKSQKVHTMLDTGRHFSFIKQKIMDAGELCLVVYLGCMFG